eukprot:CAMPEP_0118928200 /NCGR_PEP_ID=MMETSP1169-20130426/5508_1 /TAXON_ID=36882 /ORGANISM="Pyramimonas obovata, Strain CCMP722" /LENGTH=80 /DNA_ID=CAMNT_0006870123 /DNA_START=468 /DNA_END=710 /DNA_ORIENTATION=+
MWKQTTSATTIVVVTLPAALAWSCSSRTLHSKCTPDSAHRGGATSVEGTGVSPESLNSSSSEGKLPQVWLAASTNHSLMM